MAKIDFSELLHKIHIRLINLIPITSIRRKTRKRVNEQHLLRIILRTISQGKSRQNKTLERISQKVKKEEKIRVLFAIIYDGIFQWEPVYRKMLLDDMFSPILVVIPDTSRGIENQKKSYQRCLDSLRKRFPTAQILTPYDPETGTCQDITGDCDIYISMNPYDGMTHPLYSIRYVSGRGIPCLFANYAYSGRTNYEKKVWTEGAFCYYSRIFCENEFVMQDIQENRKIPVNNLVLIGYPKMDRLAACQKQERKRKKIIIAPHHTIGDWKGGLNLGTFLKFADFFAELPCRYPEMDFVFRPHPLLQYRLYQFWGEEKTDRYFQKMQAYENVECQLCGDYFDTFVNSDGMIHDCGSFLSEYLYTDHPQLYLLRGEESIRQEFTPFGQEILKHVYLGYSEKDIICFIEEVVLKESDFMKSDRIKFAKEKIMINYPFASDTVLAEIKKLLCISR